MRINQFIAHATGMARRAADRVVSEGRVEVNGTTAIPGTQVEESDVVKLDHRPLAIMSAYSYIMLNKPVGYVTSRRQQGSDPTIYDLLPQNLHSLRPIGRLDRDSSGLLLLSDDGPFINELTHPSYEKTKIYDLTLARAISSSDLTNLTGGVKLEDGLSRLQVIRATGKQIRVGLSEGRNRQLRRTFGTLGNTVVTLHRVQVGPYRLEGLQPGHWQTINPGRPA